MCGLGLNFYIGFFFVKFLMLEFVLVHVIDLIEFLALELLRLNERVIKTGLIGQVTERLFLRSTCFFHGYLELVSVVKVMAFDVLLQL